MSKARERLTQQYLRELFSYDPETGVLTNRVTRSRAKAGAEAGSIKRTRGKVYRQVVIEQKWVPTHRLIWMHVTGEFPAQVDHIDGDGLNNRFSNLRSVTQMENCMNQRLRHNNKSGHTGVIWNKSARKWRALIRSEYRLVYLGSYSNIEDAIAARQAANVKYGFHENHGRTQIAEMV